MLQQHNMTAFETAYCTSCTCWGGAAVVHMGEGAEPHQTKVKIIIEGKKHSFSPE